MPLASTPLLRECEKQVLAYVAGRLRRFSLPLDLTGCTSFTAIVLAACAEIGYGRIDTYGALAEMIGKPGAARAVGGALGRNPLPIVIPCHRVVSATGIGGFTGGLEYKRQLWEIEGISRWPIAP